MKEIDSDLKEKLDRFCETITKNTKRPLGDKRIVDSIIYLREKGVTFPEIKSFIEKEFGVSVTTSSIASKYKRLVSIG